jgi:hypothetical protein
MNQLGIHLVDVSAIMKELSQQRSVPFLCGLDEGQIRHHTKKNKVKKEIKRNVEKNKNEEIVAGDPSLIY